MTGLIPLLINTQPCEPFTSQVTCKNNKYPFITIATLNPVYLKN